MQRSFILFQTLICAGLMAQDMSAANTAVEKKSGACSTKPTAADTSPCFMQGDEPVGMPVVGAYNYPGNVNVTNGWDVYGDVSYILWYTKQDGLDLATSGHLFADDVWAPAIENGKVVFQDANYTSGFKIGVGANLNVDDWVVDLTYTYLRQETNTNSGAPSAPAGETGLFNVSNWFQSNYYGGQDVATSFTSKWKMHLDWLDLQFSRPYYLGRRLLVTPSAGLRASWIRQQLHVSSPNLYNVYESDTDLPVVSGNHSGSWAIGPRALVDMRWLVAKGFRFEGNIGGSLLFTQFTKLSHRESNMNIDGDLSGGVQVSISDYNCLRAMGEASLGIGWGSYFYQKKYHLDFGATYDFNYLWSQNMMRYLIGVSNPFATGAAPGDLMLHGLDLKARFDF